ncbi:MAG: hypothetical protein KAI43_07760 [Candidatus Aureabacteria bacterium]|nr:hypothetical protein [Candidatus Auribacterota bacterium]
MIVYAPYMAVIFWGTMIFLGLRSAIVQRKIPLIDLLQNIKKKMGNLIWIVIVILLHTVIFLTYKDSEAIRLRETPVGIFTTLAFLPLIIADLLLAVKLFLKIENQE